MKGILGLATAALLLVVAVPFAHADVDGPCRVEVAGQSVAGRSADDRDDAIAVRDDQAVAYLLEGDIPITSWRLVIHYGPAVIPFDEGTDAEGRDAISGQAHVDRLARYGGGLYRVTATATLQDGSTCTAEVLVHVQGPIINAVTGTAAAAGIAGFWLLLQAVLQLAVEGKDYVDAVRDFREGKRLK